MMMKSILARGAVSAAAFTVILAAGTGAAAAQPKPGGAPPANAAVPNPRIVVIDRSAILGASRVAQDIIRQVNGYRQSAESQFRAEGQGLEKEGRALQQQVAILAPDVKGKKIRDFQAKQAGFQRKVEARQGLIQGGVFKARQQVEQALGPILQGIMQERGANLMLDRSAVVFGTGNFDITGLAIQRLNQKMPSVKVDLVPLPANVQAQMAQQAQRR
jgi:outer membrane protein